MAKLKIQDSYKVGIDEIEGLKETLVSLMNPVLEAVQNRIYWNDSLELSFSEYTSRDGFTPFSSNCGGVELTTIVPNCEISSFDFLEYVECEDCNELAEKNELNSHGEIAQCGYEGQECGGDSEGHNDSKVRVWFKFEGLDDDKTMNFWLYLGGGNGDAPYFRANGETTFFETSFQCKTLAELRRIGKIQVNKLLKKIEGK